jgi:ATP-dependent helicase HrpB
MLPIYQVQPDIIQALTGSNRLVLSAPTGSGKTTQLPQILHTAGLIKGQTVILQPRRLAARLVAARVAQEMSSPVGGLVGYQTRHDNRIGPDTKIRFVTEGLFLRQLSNDPLISKVGAVVLDEFHERHLATDTVLALVKQLQESKRPDLKLIVMSATLDVAMVSAYLNAPSVESQGKMFPVNLHYLSSRTTRPIWETAADALSHLVNEEPEGDILIFMPGAYEIRRTIETCASVRGPQPLSFFPLYSELPVPQQDAALGPSINRKVIVSTNIAETSITIEGVRHVIDSGLARQNRFDPRRGINVLMVEPISQSSAQQRQGRAGRLAPGTCWRLWPLNEHKSRPLHDDPEVKRLDLAEVVLQLRSMGIDNPATFPWLQPPDTNALSRADTLLKDLGAISPTPSSSSTSGGGGGLTDIGREMAALPMHPRLSRVMVQARQQNCSVRAALWAAMISERDILLKGAAKRYAEELGPDTPSDFDVLETAYFAALAHNFDPGRCQNIGVHAIACRELQRTHRLYLDSLGIRNPENLAPAKPGEALAVIKALLAGFPDHVALRKSTGSNLAVQLADNRKGELDPESAVKNAPLLLTVEVQEVGSGTGVNASVRTVCSLVSRIDPQWLMDLFPDQVSRRLVHRFNDQQRQIEAWDQLSYRGLALTEERTDKIDLDRSAEMLADLILGGTLKLDSWDEHVLAWIDRTRCCADWFPEKGLIRYSEEDLKLILMDLCTGASRFAQIRDKPAIDFVKNGLSWDEQQLVEKATPVRLQMPSGKFLRITYQPGARPRGNARIQDFYGLTQTPTVANGRQKVLLEILAPNYKPVQVTDDLDGFWKNLYPTLKKEYARRYPRHEWR